MSGKLLGDIIFSNGDRALPDGCKIDIVGRQHFSMLGRLLSDDIRASL